MTIFNAVASERNWTLVLSLGSINRSGLCARRTLGLRSNCVIGPVQLRFALGVWALITHPGPYCSQFSQGEKRWPILRSSQTSSCWLQTTPGGETLGPMEAAKEEVCPRLISTG